MVNHPLHKLIHNHLRDRKEQTNQKSYQNFWMVDILYWLKRKIEEMAKYQLAVPNAIKLNKEVPVAQETSRLTTNQHMLIDLKN